MTAMPEPLLITVAPTGAETAKADCPQLPTTPEELAATAVACREAGAAMIHIHVRDHDHQPTLDLPLLREWVAAVRESTDLVVQLSTGGSVHDPLDTRLKVLDAEPDSCSLTMGTTNFGNDVFMNPWPFVCELYQLSQERGVVPEFELFDLGQVHALDRLLGTYGLPAGGKVHCDLVMGVPGGMNGTADALVASVAALPAATTSWSATGIGCSTLAVKAPRRSPKRSRRAASVASSYSPVAGSPRFPASWVIARSDSTVAHPTASKPVAPAGSRSGATAAAAMKSTDNSSRLSIGSKIKLRSCPRRVSIRPGRRRSETRRARRRRSG